MKRALVLVAICLLGAAAADAFKVEVARSPGVDYSAFRSFGFKAQDGIPADHPLGEDGELFKEVSEAAAEALLARGLTRVEGDTPDLWVTFFGLTEEELSIEGTSKKLGPGVRWIGDPGAHSSRTVLHATLIVEIHDAAGKERIWSGWASGDTQNPEKIRSRAAKAVRKILAEFPRE